MKRDKILQTARDQLEEPIFKLFDILENTMESFANVPHVDTECRRSMGSVLNAALPSAAKESGLENKDIQIKYCSKGRCNKISGHLITEGKKIPINMEIHLCGARGGTMKKKHQFAFSKPETCDVDREPSLFDIDMDAPNDLLFFIAYYLNGTNTSVSRVYLKFADGVDQRMVEMHRPVEEKTKVSSEDGPDQGPHGTMLKIKKPDGDKKNVKTDKSGNAASGS